MNEQLDRLRLLIVDDSEYMRRVLCTVLRGIGISQIIEAESGPAAIGMLREQQIDIVFTDWMMQPMTGPELVLYLRNSEFSPDRYIPIVMVTGHSEAKNIKVARDMGITEFLAKPLTPKAVYERILAIIERPRPFVRSKQYFGPDRRRQAKTYRGGEKRR